MTYQISAKLSSGQMVHVAWYLWEWRVVRRQMKGPINVFLLTDLEGGNIDSNFSYQVSSFFSEYLLITNVAITSYVLFFRISDKRSAEKERGEFYHRNDPAACLI